MKLMKKKKTELKYFHYLSRYSNGYIFARHSVYNGNKKKKDTNIK